MTFIAMMNDKTHRTGSGLHLHGIAQQTNIDTQANHLRQTAHSLFPAIPAFKQA
ncbi:hypothetical protein yrohd0001_4210 [Yersinia rohdei ATCC 43380]|nr:hypothetical protein yrohd0001_4210 [Yersinia rohdei ATCC 43380]